MRLNFYSKVVASVAFLCLSATSLAAVERSLPALVYPLMSPRVSGKFGLRKHPIHKVSKHHAGIDLAAPKNAPIRVVRNGLVVFADPHGGYGNLVVVQHENGYTSHYGHCQSIHVQIGQRVTAGQIIANVGSTGRSTGPHLHFELRQNGKALDPEEYVPGLTARPEG